MVFLRLMGASVAHSAVYYKDLVPNVGRTKGKPRTPPPAIGRSRTASVEGPRADGPAAPADQDYSGEMDTPIQEILVIRHSRN
jgi:hypothetical protein